MGNHTTPTGYQLTMGGTLQEFYGAFKAFRKHHIPDGFWAFFKYEMDYEKDREALNHVDETTLFVYGKSDSLTKLPPEKRYMMVGAAMTAGHYLTITVTTTGKGKSILRATTAEHEWVTYEEFWTPFVAYLEEHEYIKPPTAESKNSVEAIGRSTDEERSKKRKGGRPRLSCNKWASAQIIAGENEQEVYQGWLCRREEETGADPTIILSDPWDSFRKATKAARKTRYESQKVEETRRNKTHRRNPEQSLFLRPRS